jgi:hypothetical protein
MDDLAEDGLVESVKEVPVQVERAMMELRGAWNGLVRQERQAKRDQLRRDIKGIRYAVEHLFGR